MPPPPFYAVDRYASFQKVWRKEYEAGRLILSDRYTTSNAVHRAPAAPLPAAGLFQWLEEFECDRLGLPRPDLVIYLDVPTDLTEVMLRNGSRIPTPGGTFMSRTSITSACAGRRPQEAAAYFHWHIISCDREGALRPISEIHQDIYNLVQTCLKE